MKKQKLVAALMSIVLGKSTVFSTVAFAEGSVLPNSGVEMGTTENSEVVLPKKLIGKIMLIVQYIIMVTITKDLKAMIKFKVL